MTQSAELTPQSFVLLRLGERRFAIAATQVAELVAPSRIFRFPHRTPKLEGVILRRGRIIPVCDVAESLLGRSLASRRFFLIAVRHYANQDEWVALPVSGDCELIIAEMTPASEHDAPHVSGWISHNGEVIEALSLDAVTPGDRRTSLSSGDGASAEARP
jgi:chemotaxis signal transduction protein